MTAYACYSGKVICSLFRDLLRTDNYVTFRIYFRCVADACPQLCTKTVFCNLSPPEDSAQRHQKAWDTPKVAEIAVNLLENAPDARCRARLLAASTKEAGTWLNSLPISSLGLRMDDDTIRVAIGLRLGSSLCRPHVCAHCGAEVDSLVTHGLSCRWSEGCHHRHAALNDILHRALTSARVPSRLEPSGLYRSDGKRPDGITVVPWKNGKLLV